MTTLCNIKESSNNIKESIKECTVSVKEYTKEFTDSTDSTKEPDMLVLC